MAPAGVDVAAMAAGVLAGTPAWVGRAITLVESTRGDHRAAAQQLLATLTPHTGGAHRVGVSGIPGAGKSTFIDALGCELIAAGHRVAVLAVDPSSTRGRGSILGDKTRMARLAAAPGAYVRPSPTAGTLGGVTKATREAIVVVEAARYDVVVVETVGVGQSEATVAEMVDSFLLLALARTGDRLQGIKKGILELADVIAINKADGPHAAEARRAARELTDALRLLHRGEQPSVVAPVVTCSAQEGTGVADVWSRLVAHRERLAASGELVERRRRQQVAWMWSMVRDSVLSRFHAHPRVRATADDLEQRVLDGSLTPAGAAEQMLAAYDRDVPERT
ncbi:methylmalonyl Co-A mutase-associated GTPase MeaB [Plantactinospora endophytica]|uniref:ATPase/protein kinase n=1 Tax=Plantactinospora endophytica TaxID=673535 RepID=A0ABQ4EAZ8_9ACTN|nr:methylmalonyl Co-A mutase-associated GTPase MeaB [Plantactinospora endophytica]GIG91442.1 ATPase/protein kinase [Plantactinospora endophytica]